MGPDRISLTGLTVRGLHGVFPEERRDGQDFRVDIHLDVDTRAAAASDDLADTVDYGALAVRAAEIIAGEPADLIETVAERIARAALRFPGVRAAEIELHKPQAPIELSFSDVSVRIRREHEIAAGGPDDAVIALGANLGEAHETLQAAVEALDLHPAISVTAVSQIYRTAPVGGAPQPDFLNAAVGVSTDLTPHELLAALHGIEGMAGRVRAERNGPRVLDLDLIVHGAQRIDDGRLRLPHPRAHERAFVLVPWADLQPDARVPDVSGAMRGIGELAAEAPDRDGLMPTGVGLHQPGGREVD